MQQRIQQGNNNFMGRGLVLLLDGISGINHTSYRTVKKFLGGAVEAVNMEAISSPEVVLFNGHHARGIILLAESHVSVHWDKPHLFVDIFSCKQFDVEVVVLWICAEWCINSGSYTVLRRGWEWTSEELKVQRVVVLEKMVANVPSR
jgi:S-adenosylmethionine/arginine decarboxylase-like enzyme